MDDASIMLAPRDQGRINLAEPREVRYWTQELHVSEAHLRAAVSAAGDATPAVRQYLCGQPESTTNPSMQGWQHRPQVRSQQQA